jgi:hypothetical protein
VRVQTRARRSSETDARLAVFSDTMRRKLMKIAEVASATAGARKGVVAGARQYEVAQYACQQRQPRTGAAALQRGGASPVARSCPPARPRRRHRRLNRSLPAVTAFNRSPSLRRQCNAPNRNDAVELSARAGSKFTLPRGRRAADGASEAPVKV